MEPIDTGVSHGTRHLFSGRQWKGGALQLCEAQYTCLQPLVSWLRYVFLIVKKPAETTPATRSAKRKAQQLRGLDDGPAMVHLCTTEGLFPVRQRACAGHSHGE